MRTIFCVFCLVLAASSTRAQTSKDEARCFASGGVGWDGTKPNPPRCTCSKGKMNAINAGGVCSREKPNCDKCVPAGTRGHVRIVERKRAMPPSCEELCKALGDAVARWNKDAPQGSQCEPVDPEQYLAGECAVVPKPVKEPSKEELCQKACETTSGGAAYWAAYADPDKQCQPRDTEQFMAGPCTIVPQPAEQDTRLVCGLVCAGFGGKLTEHGCQCPDGAIADGECGCRLRFVKAEPVFHIGGELRVLGLIVKEGPKGLYVPVGVAPSLVLRFDPWGPGKDLVLAAGPLITGNGGEAGGTPVGVALLAGVYHHLADQWQAGFELDGNWYAVDRTGEALAFSVGGRLVPVRWGWKLRRGECHAGGGIGGAYLLPEEMTAFIWGLSAGCTAP